MIPQRKATRALRSAGALVVAALTLVGCTPEAAPTPTPTAAFASEEEAFAAAEEVYRAYIEALNDVDFSDPSSFEAVYALLDKEASTAARESFSQFHADDVTVTGLTRFDSFVGDVDESTSETVVVTVCLDVTEVDVRDRDGKSLVASDRPNVQAMTVSFLNSRADMRITTMQADAEQTCTA